MGPRASNPRYPGKTRTVLSVDSDDMDKTIDAAMQEGTIKPRVFDKDGRPTAAWSDEFQAKLDNHPAFKKGEARE